jgi:hypothetical protein
MMSLHAFPTAVLREAALRRAVALTSITVRLPAMVAVSLLCPLVPESSSSGLGVEDPNGGNT